MAFWRKRKFSSQGGRTSKRRRFSGRRRVFGRRGRSTIGTTQQFGSATIQYRGRRLGLRRWRRKLYSDTVTKTHYRSRSTTVSSQVTGTTAGDGTVAELFAESGAAANASFWLTANGAQPIDVGGAVPTFNSDIILRGGKISMTLSVADGVTDTVLVRAWLVFTNDDPDVTVVTTPQPMAWDPSSNADFAQRYGKVIAYRQAYLKYNQTILNMEHRVKPRKIDMARHAVAGQTFVWIVHTINLTSTTSVTVNRYKSYNFSFCGDAIT